MNNEAHNTTVERTDSALRAVPPLTFRAFGVLYGRRDLKRAERNS